MVGRLTLLLVCADAAAARSREAMFAAELVKAHLTAHLLAFHRNPLHPATGMLPPMPDNLL